MPRQIATNEKKEEQKMSFETFNLHETINAGVRSLGYAIPTPIQQEAIPPIIAGRDVMGLAQTGTGKTAAFVLPILQRLMRGPRGRVRALILAPTRELTEQTNKAIGLLGRRTKLSSTSVYGGINIQGQIGRLRNRVEIVAACPGRLLDHISRRTIDLAHVEVLVLDEADRMFDMGFLPDIRKIVRHLPVNRQTLLFSATMPGDIKALAGELLRDPVHVQIGHTAPAATVAHTFYPVASERKNTLLKNILATTDTEAVLVFTRTKHRAKSLARQLEQSGYDATSLHGNLSQGKRQQALDGFRNGRHKILVATDIAARGIDVARISHVINYDMPDTTEAYTHRIGRTGRAEKTGHAFSFVTGQDKGIEASLGRALGELLQYQGGDGPSLSASAHTMSAHARSNTSKNGHLQRTGMRKVKVFKNDRSTQLRSHAFYS